MRAVKTLLASATTFLLLAGVAVPMSAQDPPVKVEVEHSVWYLEPVWLAVGGILLLLIVILAVMAGRGRDGGTTTVIR